MRRAPAPHGTTTMLAELKRRVAAAPADAATQLEIARTYAGLGRNDDATEHLEKAHSLAPTDAGVLLELGNARYRSGRYDAAARAYRDAMRLAPAWSSPVANLAACEIATFDYASAVNGYRAALALDAHDAAALNGYGAALHLANRFAEAINWLTAAIANDPCDAVLRLILGRALRDNGDVDRSAKVFEDVADADEQRLRRGRNSRRPSRCCNATTTPTRRYGGPSPSRRRGRGSTWSSAISERTKDVCWGQRGADTAWYPSATLYRCARPGAWNDVVEQAGSPSTRYVMAAIRNAPSPRSRVR